MDDLFEQTITMEITRTSVITGKEHTREINITQEQLDSWEGGELIQNVAPRLSPDDREFIINGITPDEWDEYMGTEDQEYDY